MPYKKTAQRKGSGQKKSTSHTQPKGPIEVRAYTASHGTTTTPIKRTARPTQKNNNKRGGYQGKRRGNAQAKPKPTTLGIPPAGDNVRVLPLGGLEEVGKNMVVVEHKDDIIIVDAGFQFVEEDSPGIDYILPNIKYLEERRDKIRGIVVTHGHLDHIGAIPYIMEKLGYPPIYTRPLTVLMIKKRQEEFRHMKTLDIREVNPGEKIKLGKLTTRFIPVTHSIPDSMGVLIETTMGNVILSGDLKLDHTKGEPSEKEIETWGAIGREKNLLFIPDSTNAENPGFSITEHDIHKEIERILKEAPSRLIIGTFASQFERMLRFIQVGIKHNRKIITEGRSIKTNIEIAKRAGLIGKEEEKHIIPVQDIDKYPPHKVLVLATGAQGEEFAALMRVATNKHKYIKLNEKDTIILSSSVIPGNEIDVQKLKDNLYRHRVKIIHYKVSDVHATGHGNQGELAWIDKQVNARFYMPGYGYRSMTQVHAELIIEKGIAPKDRVLVVDNGTIIDFVDGGKNYKILKERAPATNMMVDGLAIGDIQEVVMRDRQMLAQEGIFMVVVTIDLNTGKLRKSPDLISRGFVYLRESQELLHEARSLTRKTVEDTLVGMHPIDFDIVKDRVTDEIAKFLLQRTGKRPIVIPVILGI